MFGHKKETKLCKITVREKYYTAGSPIQPPFIVGEDEEYYFTYKFFRFIRVGKTYNVAVSDENYLKGVEGISSEMLPSCHTSSGIMRITVREKYAYADMTPSSVITEENDHLYVACQISTGLFTCDYLDHFGMFSKLKIGKTYDVEISGEYIIKVIGEIKT